MSRRLTEAVAEEEENPLPRLTYSTLADFSQGEGSVEGVGTMGAVGVLGVFGVL